MRPRDLLGGLALPWLLTACGHTPTPPAADVPTLLSPSASWQGTPPGTLLDTGNWRVAQPGDHLPKARWWQVFEDPVLDALQDQALQGSPSLQAAAARVRQARALADAAGAGRLPRVDAGLRGTRTRTSANRPAATAQAEASSSLQNDVVLQGAVSYEPDLFGRQRLTEQSALAQAEQARADRANAHLELSADLAAVYFQLRSLETEVQVVEQGLASQTRAAELLAARHDGGAASGLDVAQQQALLDATRTQLTLLRKQQAQGLHALATLVGAPASTFALPAAARPAALPTLPVALPSEVLQRRPDVAAAERALAAANAQLGLAERAWFPSLTVSATAGWESKDIARLFDAPSLLWALGGGLTQAVFDGGRIRAAQEQARAGHDLATANYRQVVLRAFQEVEDGLSSLNALHAAVNQAEAATRSAQRVLDIAQSRYAGGLSTYLDVVTAQQNVLNNQRLGSQLRGQQQQATAYLVKALGGGWEPDL